jgi:hypothetical protein
MLDDIYTVNTELSSVSLSICLRATVGMANLRMPLQKKKVSQKIGWMIQFMAVSMGQMMITLW